MVVGRTNNQNGESTCRAQHPARLQVRLMGTEKEILKKLLKLSYLYQLGKQMARDTSIFMILKRRLHCAYLECHVEINLS